MGWRELPLDLVGDVMAYLPLPGDRARFASVCRAWRSAARQFASRMPWIVLPDGTVCSTIGHDAAVFRIPGLPPENVTCLGAVADEWLALDCTDDPCRRTPWLDNYCPDIANFKNDPRPDVKHRHTYLLYNLFSKATVPLPELDAIIGYVTETFEVRKVLMRSSSSDDDPHDNAVIAVTTNHIEYNVILCRPGKGAFVLPYHEVIDVAFIGDTLFGLTTSEELLAFHLGEDEDGRPNLTRFERAINNPLRHQEFDDEEEEDHAEDDDDQESDDGDEDHEEDDDDQESDDGDEDHEEDDAQESDDDEEDHEEDDDQESDEEAPPYQDQQESDDDDEEAANQEAWVDDGCTVPDNEESERYYEEEERPYESYKVVGRYLVQSCSGELLLVRHRHLVPPQSSGYTLNVGIFRADLCAGKWVSSNSRLPKGESLFLSRSVSKCTRACGDIPEGFVFYTARLQDVFDTASLTTREMPFKWPWQRIRREHSYLRTWFFSPKELHC